MSRGPLDFDALLPHGPAARFVREIVALEPESIVVRGAVPADGPFVEAGVAPAVIAVELAAQAAGLLEACGRAEAPGTPGAPADVGYIVGLRELTLKGDHVPAGRDLTARVTLDGVARPLTIYRVEVSLDSESLLEGKISIFTAPPGAVNPP